MKIFKTNIIMIILFISCYSYAQKKEVVDSLWNKYRNAENDSIKLKAANYLAFHYIFKTPTRADSILSSATAYAKKSNQNFGLNELTNTRGIYYDVLGQKDSSKVYFEKALQLSRKFKYPSIESMCINNLGMFCWNNGQFKEALEYFYQALEFVEINNPKSDKKSTYYNNIGLIYQELSQFEKAIEYHKKALAIRKKYDRTKDIAGSYNNLAICHKNLNDLNQAEKFIELAIEYAEKANQPRFFYQFQDTYGNILNLQKKYKMAEKAYLTALDLPDEYQNYKRTQFITYSNLIDLYYTTRQFNKAKSLIQKAEKLINEDTSLENYSESFYISSAKIYFALQDIEKAEKYFENYTIYKDSLFSEQNANALADVEAKLKTKEKEAELVKTKNELLEKELKVRQQNLIIYGSISALVILIVVSYLIIKSKQLKNQKIQKESKLNVALAKIELKNKLEEQRLRISRDLHDNIGSQLTFVISGLQYLEYQKDIKTDKLNSKLKQLGHFTQQTIHELRDTIWAMNKESIKLSDLINRFNNTKNQLDIKEVISIDIPENLKQDSKAITFSALEGIQIYRIIQESINNAIKHANATDIKVVFNIENHVLKIKIQDNGEGFDKTKTKEGNGLQNMRKRADNLKGTFELKSQIDNGTSVYLTIPLTSDKIKNDR